MSHATTTTRASGGRRSALAGVALLAVVIAGCTAEAAPSVAPTPRPTPTPAPTATPMPGTPLPEAYRPEGDWTVTFALPGDFITETWRIVLTCPKGSCDAVVEMRDAKGKARGRAELALQDGRYVLRTTTSATVDCTAAGAQGQGRRDAPDRDRRRARHLPARRDGDRPADDPGPPDGDARAAVGVRLRADDARLPRVGRTGRRRSRPPARYWPRGPERAGARA